MHLTYFFNHWTRKSSVEFSFIETSSTAILWELKYTHTCTHTMKEKRFPYMHYLWTCTHFPFLPPPPHLLESCKAPFAPGLCQLALCHKSISSIHLLSSCLGNSPVSPLTCNGAALLSGLLTNWPIMGVMDAAGSCLPLSNLHVRFKVSA